MSGVIVVTVIFGPGASNAAPVNAATGNATPRTAAETAVEGVPYSGGRLIAADPSGGYWTVDSMGAITSWEGAPSFGSPALSGLHLARPIVGMATTPDGGGYWLVAADGGIFTFGDAAFYGSTGALRLNQPIVGMATTPDGGGYWLVAADGGIFTFGDAAFYGSTGGGTTAVTGIIVNPTAGGYTLVQTDGIAVSPFSGAASSATSSPTTPGSPTTARSPNELFNLSQWNLVLPIESAGATDGANGTGNSAETIDSSELIDGFTDPYFRLNSQSQLVFTAPSNGATTTTSSHTRSELHENYTGPNAATDGCWLSSLGGTLQATAVVNAVSVNSNEATIGQIHGDGSAAFVLLMYEPATQEVVLTTFASPTDTAQTETLIESDVALTQTLDYQLSFRNGVITATVNGISVTQTAGTGWDNYPVRFDLGAYSAAPHTGNPAGDDTEVTFSSFSVTH
jgi:hypothetical protein